MLGKLLVPIPPLSEQRNIAFILSSVQQAIEKTEAVIQATKELKKSLMNHLFTYGPVPITEREQVQLKETKIGEIPEEWEVVRIKDVYEFSKKPTNITISEDDELPFIPMEYISEENETVNGWELKKRKEFSSGSFAFKNDLVIAKITPSFENGKQAILSNIPMDYCYLTTEIYALHPKDDRSSNKHLYDYLKQEKIRREMAGKMEGTTGRQRLPKTVVANQLIPLPSNSEQKKISEIFKILDERVENERNEITALKHLFNSMLENLMTGTIRVKDLNLNKLQSMEVELLLLVENALLFKIQ